MNSIDYLKFLISKYKLRKFFRAASMDEIYDATRNFVGHGIYSRISMSQKPTEISLLADAVKAIKPQVIVEIGTRKGGTLFTWCRYTQATEIISIDLPGGIHGGGYPEGKQAFYKYFLSDQPNRNLHLLQKDSHQETTLNEVKNILNNRLIDFLFIDGDHTYAGVKMDFEMYSPLVRKGGIIAFHDIIPNTTSHEDAATIEVPRFWNELKDKYPSKEFIESAQQGNMGIGIIYK